MKPNPIRRCAVCGKRIIRMIKVHSRFGGYKLTWSRAVYCSNACRQYAYRQRLKSITFRDIIPKRNPAP